MMYKKQIEEYFNLHKDEMLEDICKVIRIKSDRQEPKEGMPFGEGVVKVLKEALDIASNMGFATNNYDNYVGTVDFNDKEKALDILAHLDVVPAGDEWTVTEPVSRTLQIVFFFYERSGVKLAVRSQQTP